MSVITALALSTVLVPGGWYSQACVTGEYFHLVRDQYVETHRERVPLPPGGNVLYLTSPCDGSGRFAGIGNRDDRAWEWTEGRWHDRGMAFGVNGVIYDANDVLRVVWEPGTPTGSQGWRYVADDGRLVTGDESYNCGGHLWECTVRGDVRCGQGGDEEGLQCDVRGRRVLVQEGIIRAIRFERQGNAIALAWSRHEGEGSAGRFIGTVAELDALPTYTIPDGTTPPPPPPPPPPPVECGEVPIVGQHALRELAARFPSLIQSPDDDERRQWALMAAEQMAFSVGPTWGTKRAGEGRPQSKDALAKFVGTTLCGWDIVDGNSRELRFGRGEAIPDQIFIPVTPRNHLVDTEPPPPPDGDLKERVAALEASIVDLHGMVTILDRAVADARAEIDALARRPDNGVPKDQVLALIEAALKDLYVEGGTSRAWGHGHSINLPIRRR